MLAVLDSLQIILTVALLVVGAVALVTWGRSRPPSERPIEAAPAGQRDHGAQTAPQASPLLLPSGRLLPAGTVTSREELRAKLQLAGTGRIPAEQSPQSVSSREPASIEPALPEGTVNSREELRARIGAWRQAKPERYAAHKPSRVTAPVAPPEPILPIRTVTSRDALRARLAVSDRHLGIARTRLLRVLQVRLDQMRAQPSAAESIPAPFAPRPRLSSPRLVSPHADKIAWAIDCETTGLAYHDRIISFGAVELSGMVPTGNYIHLVFNPGVKSHWAARRMHGWDDWTLQHQLPFARYAPHIHAALAGADLIVGHNLEFDMSFLGREFRAAGLPALTTGAYCTMRAFRKCYPGSRASLDTCIGMIGGRRQSEIHGALEDAFLAANLYRWLAFKNDKWMPLPAVLPPTNLQTAPPNPR